jgi:stage III sporulation protein AF
VDSLDALRVWVISLITISVICSLAEKLAPEGGVNKYVKLVCGLVAAIVIIGPAVRFLGGDFKIQEVAWNDYMTMSKGEMEKRIRRLEEKDAGELLEIYRQSIISDVKYRYQGEKDFVVAGVDLVLQEDNRSSDYGAIRELYIRVSPPTGNEKAAFGRLDEDRIRAELSQALGIDKDRIIVDSSNFKGR